MVNLGPSKGCQTCKQRRIKCDEGKPSCERCLRVGRQCGGYSKKPVIIRFREDTIKESAIEQAQKSPHQRQQVLVARKPSLVPALSPVQRDVALAFFLGHFATTGRDFESARGFFEVLSPVVAKEAPSSAISTAVTAIATRMHTLWRDGATASPSTNCLQTHSLALKRLQQALKDHKELTSQTTVLAALVLQFYENISAAWKRRRPASTHHEGAVALLMSQLSTNKSHAGYGGHLLAYILHNEVSSALSEQRPVPSRIRSWINDDKIPLNPSTTLDIIGISIANVQTRFLRLLAQDNLDPALSQRDLEEVWNDLRSIDDDLMGWMKTLPRDWRPFKMRHVEKTSPPIATYSRSYDIYPSVQIAAVWNTWRCYRLMLLRIALILIHDRPDALPLKASNVDCFSTELPIISWVEDSIQELFDSVCESVPFHLGNCTRRSTLYDFADTSIVFPSYHDLPPHDAVFLEHLSSDRFMSSEDHRHHVIVLGSWHILSPLGYLLQMFSSEYSNLLSKTIRRGQKEWIYQQMIRATAVLDMEPMKKPETDRATPVLI
ncbi:hypothetical protein B0J13DRAFT_637253 [Dactylonectria estremocensis]|uniref:Zn(2)-C6 fungal-type domain-containing protein n=1 Tax=Dactylonectria estremocensis TaxID=1079267 RepID=A0A9P9EQS0_9HYPO|nr:hypothetical protein B0J13DRAFT_637253 [Dactylonectria estremocensis]